VEATTKYSINSSLCEQVDLQVLSGQFGLQQGWEQAMTASCSAQASCTNCCRGECKGVIVEHIRTYEYREHCIDFFGNVTAINIYNIEVIEREPLCRATSVQCPASP